MARGGGGGRGGGGDRRMVMAQRQATDLPLHLASPPQVHTGHLLVIVS